MTGLRLDTAPNNVPGTPHGEASQLKNQRPPSLPPLCRQQTVVSGPLWHSRPLSTFPFSDRAPLSIRRAGVQALYVTALEDWHCIGVKLLSFLQLSNESGLFDRCLSISTNQVSFDTSPCHTVICRSTAGRTPPPAYARARSKFSKVPSLDCV